jgi:NADH-quinone oxidoreductase subunit M
MAFLLVLSIFVPLVGTAMIVCLAQVGRQTVRAVALVTTLVVLAAAVMLTWQYTAERAPDGSFAVSEFAWLHSADGRFDLKFSLGLDGLSLWLFGLSALLMVTSVLVSWESIADRAHGFYAVLLVLETGLLGVFAARDIILFYVFFEFTLIPLFFIIGIWGSEERRLAAIKFFLFTFAGSVLTFLGLLAIVLWEAGYIGAVSAWQAEPPRRMTFSIPELTRDLWQRPLAGELPQRYKKLFDRLNKDGDPTLSKAEAAPVEGSPQAERFQQLDRNGDGKLTPQEFAAGDGRLEMWIFLALFVGFAIKVPLFPLHTWLPLAHVQAPTAGSVLLAGVLLKIGTYGFVRFSLPMLPHATAACMPWVLWLSVAGIVYAALVALAQSDMKRLIAYSSVSHLGFCMVGIFALNPLGLEGGVLQMINHGLSTGGLFALVGMIYQRYHTRKISDLGGLAARTPLLAFFFVVFTLSSIGLPGLNGFAGEFLLLTGMFQRGRATPGAYGAEFLWIAVLATTGVILGAWYMLYLVQRVFFGPLQEPVHESGDSPVKDLSTVEVSALAPLLVFMVWIGLQPGFFLSRMYGTLEQTVVLPGIEAGKLHSPGPPPKVSSQSSH